MTLKRELLELRERVERVVVLGDSAGAEAIDFELRAEGMDSDEIDRFVVEVLGEVVGWKELVGR